MARLAHAAREDYRYGSYAENFGRLFPRYLTPHMREQIALGYDSMFQLAEQYLRLPKSER